MICSKFWWAHLHWQRGLATKFVCYSTSASPAVVHQRVWRRHALRTGIALIAAGLAHDSLNEFQYCGGAGRFLRSMSIAAHISFDYSWNLYGVAENSDEYKKVVMFIFVPIHRYQIFRIEFEINSFVSLILFSWLKKSICAVQSDCSMDVWPTAVSISKSARVYRPSITSFLQNIRIRWNNWRYVYINIFLVCILTKIRCKTETEQRFIREQNQCLPRKPDEVKQLFIEEFGKTPDELFAEFNYEPIAAASLAQVFRAKCKDGREVAVKVQYIDLLKRFNGDFSTIQFLQSLIKRIHTNFNFSWILNDLRENLQQVCFAETLWNLI